MKGLLIKDFKLLKGQKNFFMAITAISIIMIIVSPGTSFPIGFLGFVGALFSLSSISYDEFDNGNAFSNSAPLTINLWERSFRSTNFFLCSRIFLLWIAYSSSFLLFSMLAFSSSSDIDSYLGFFALLNFSTSYFSVNKKNRYNYWHRFLM